MTPASVAVLGGQRGPEDAPALGTAVGLLVLVMIGSAALGPR